MRPNRPITLIVPWPAGGSTDTHLLKLGELAGKNLGQPVIIENKPGFGGMLGPASMAGSAKPDGYTLSQLSHSPCGIVGPKGMDPKDVKVIHDAFRKAIDHAENKKVQQHLDQVYGYRSSDDYAKWAREAWVQEKATIERRGLQKQ